MKLLKAIEKGLVFFDGAMGTMLLKSGMNLEKPLDVCNIEDPLRVEKIHRSYVEAGAQVITTNTFQANELRLKDYGYSIEAVIEAGIKLAKACGSQYVAQDIGPIGKVEPMGNLSFYEAYSIFKKQVTVGAKIGVDCILLETFFNLKEVEAAILAAKDHSNLPIFCTMTFDQKGRILSGEEAGHIANQLQSLGVDALGINCSLGPKEILHILPNFMKGVKIPVMVQANAGLPTKVEGTTQYTIDPETFGFYGSRMKELGVRILGGCCGTTPAHIHALITAIKD
ncbi:homocysteine S-methyltransferase family protein [Alkaliphilus transvaalensis]|uniref:homocysteine S-methyltransferase family protein n=1 Tax=Alkaliphilus transvaalensis TaxID=114628 RepID=UPI00047C5ABC|nr:homocysteine S-methyltransferase family protein [Alkaliphilus transvaalensis]